MTAATRTPRRELLLTSAAGLFAERGFHSVGIDDIGAAAGISGPGVYRHFAGKQALLEALVDRAMTQMLDGAQRIERESGEPAAALGALVELHVGFAVEQRSLIGVWVRETRALSEDVRRSLRRRMRAYERVWLDVLTRLRPELTVEHAALVTGATLAMLNGTAFTAVPAVAAKDVRAALRRMALAALLARD